MRDRYEEKVKLNDNLVNMCYFTYSREILGDLWWSLIKIASTYLASSQLATNAQCPDFLASIPEFLVISIGFCPKCNKLTLMEPGSWKLKINTLVSYRVNMIILENYTSWRMRYTIYPQICLIIYYAIESKYWEMNDVGKTKKRVPVIGTVLPIYYYRNTIRL
jgi:hypothetical protein